MHIFHKWTKWRNIKINLQNRGYPVGTVSGQLRTCRKCGKEESREV
jgi:hypothetical protein